MWTRRIAAVATVGAGLVVAQRWFAARRRRRAAEERWSEMIDEAGMESFPASDPPGWTLGEDSID